MAQTRRASRLTTGFAGVGLCLTLITGVLWHAASQRHEDATHLAYGHFGAWLSRGMDRISREFELFFHGGRKMAASAPTGPGAWPEAGPLPSFDPAARLGLDLTGLREALVLYKAGDLAQGDLAAASAKDPLVRTTLAWVALHDLPQDAGVARMRTFLDAHRGWPSRDVIERHIEAALYFSHADARAIEAQFISGAPQTTLGKLALARAFTAEGDSADAQRLVRALWHRSQMTPALENKVKAEFGTYLDKRDDKARADYLLYKGDDDAGLRAAALAGSGVLALAKLRIAAANNRASDKMFAAIPKAMRGDPAYLFAKIEKLRHANKFKDAAALMLTAPHDPAVLIDGDAWWLERRALARKLLDSGEPALAYQLCARHSAKTNELRIEAEFEAGWIALRFLNDPQRAAKHFESAALYARTPISIARAAYWQGRAAEASHDPVTVAKNFYERAAAESATYYGQLARQRLGLKTLALRKIAPAAKGKQRDESIRVIELLYALGEKDLAFPLAVATAENIGSQSQLAALTAIIAAQRDAHVSLIIGKILARRQLPVDNLAFPTYGVPNFEPVANSATPALVYAIARQESAFDPHAVSSAGAKGLMQMIAATAASTAKRAGLNFDPERLISDAAFNAKLGAAHLGELFIKEKGCPILVFAAYNAGDHRVRQWIEAYGDPRSPDVDPIDWVERIPFAETRNYVQRVMENLTVYRAVFGKITPPATSQGGRAAAKL